MMRTTLAHAFDSNDAMSSDEETPWQTESDAYETSSMGESDAEEEEEQDEEEQAPVTKPATRGLCDQVAEIIRADPCHKHCLRGNAQALEQVVASVSTLSRRQKKQSIRTALAATPACKPSVGKRCRFQYHLPNVGAVCMAALALCYGVSTATINRYRKAFEADNFRKGKRSCSQRTLSTARSTTPSILRIPIRRASANGNWQIPIMPSAVKDYWLLRLASQQSPWAQSQPLTAWARIASSNPHLDMDGRAMRTRFYTLVERYEPGKRLSEDASALDKQQQQVLRDVCVNLVAFQEQQTKTRAAQTEKAPDKTTMAKKAIMITITRRVTLTAQMYADLVTKKPKTSDVDTPRDAASLERQLSLLEEQVALQREQTRLHERQLVLMQQMGGPDSQS